MVAAVQQLYGRAAANAVHLAFTGREILDLLPAARIPNCSGEYEHCGQRQAG
jgi:hypothetical protein